MLVAFSFCVSGSGHSLAGESPLHARQGEGLAERQGLSIVYREVESGASYRQSTGGTNGKWIEAVERGEQAGGTDGRCRAWDSLDSSDAHVFESHGPQASGIEEVLGVHDQGPAQKVFDLCKIQAAKLRPSGSD